MSITILLKEQRGDQSIFNVKVKEGDEELEYQVEVDLTYWDQLTNKKIKPEELVKRSFEFLLEREPKESILQSFNIKVINKYFPEYEQTIKDRP